MANWKAIGGAILLIAAGVGAFLAVYYNQKDNDSNSSDHRVTPAQCLDKGGFISGGQCYNVDLKQLSWVDAEKRCVEHHLGHLASVEDEDIGGQIADLLTTSLTWFGLNDRTTEGRFRYVNKAPLNYTHWMDTYPVSTEGGNDGDDVDCVAMVKASEAKWEDLNCDELHAFVCQATLAVEPSAPRKVKAVAGGRKATVSWDVPADDGGSKVLNYTVYASPGNQMADVEAGLRSVEVTGLTGGVSYTFIVKAANDVGSSPASDPSNSVTVKAVVPSAPINVRAVAGRDFVSIFYEPPVDDGDADIVSFTIDRVNHTVPDFTPMVRTASAAVPVAIPASNTLAFVYRVRASNSIGAGAVALTAAVSGSAALPTKVRNVAAVAGPDHSQASVTFDEPDDAGSSPIANYTVFTVPVTEATTGDDSPIVVSGLTFGVSYTFIVVAQNAAGSSAASDPSSAIFPFAVPPSQMDAPLASTLPRAANVSFSAPADDGGLPVINYTVVSNPDDVTVYGTSSPIIVPGLDPRKTYRFKVSATNANGTSAFSDLSSSISIDPTEPDPAVDVAAVKGGRRATVSFTVANDGGSDITNVTVTSNPGGIVAFGLTSPIVVSGLTAFQNYTFTVVLDNAVGSSVASNASNAVAPDAELPAAPLNPALSAGTRNLTATFSPPADDGGATITVYRLTLTRVGTATTIVRNSPTSPYTFTDITASVAYTVTVAAINSVGTGPESTDSNQETPSPSVPDRPTNIVATRGDASAVVTYDAPFDGDSAIVSYTIVSSDEDVVVNDTQLESGTHQKTIVSGLTNGVPYSFKVIATNAVGDSRASAVSNEIRPKPPGNDSSSSSSASSGAIAGGVIGGVVFLILIVVFVSWYKSVACFSRGGRGQDNLQNDSLDKLGMSSSQLESAVKADMPLKDSASDELSPPATAGPVDEGTVATQI